MIEDFLSVWNFELFSLSAGATITVGQIALGLVLFFKWKKWI